MSHDPLARYDTAHGQPSVGPDYHSRVDHTVRYGLAEVAAAGGRITRLRMFREAGRIDISYCHATLPDGRIVPVRVDSGLGISAHRLKYALVAWAQAEGVYAKGIGLLDEGNWSTL